MIRSQKHAIEVQARRAKSGKRGYSKAVRRYENSVGGSAKANADYSVNWLVADKKAA